MNSFLKDYKIGEIAENELRQLLKNNNTRYSECKSLEEQHKGDFYIPSTNYYIEVKNDVMSKKTGNIYFEVGELYTEAYQYKAKAESVETVGVAQKAKLANVIFVHKIGEDRYFVYSAKRLYKHMIQLKNKANFSLALSKSEQQNKVLLGVLWTSYKYAYRSNLGNIKSTVKLTNRKNLLKTIEKVKQQEFKLTVKSENPLLNIVKAFKKVDFFLDNGYNKYKWKIRGL